MIEIILDALRPWAISVLVGFAFGAGFRAAWAVWPLKIKVVS